MTITKLIQYNSYDCSTIYCLNRDTAIKKLFSLEFEIIKKIYNDYDSPINMEIIAMFDLIDQELYDEAFESYQKLYYIPDINRYRIDTIFIHDSKDIQIPKNYFRKQEIFK